MVTITVYVGDESGRELAKHELSGPHVRLGREPDCEIRLPDPAVAPLHAVLRAGPLGWTLEGVEGAPGLRLNDAPVEAAVPIAADDRIELRPYLLRVGAAASPRLPSPLPPSCAGPGNRPSELTPVQVVAERQKTARTQGRQLVWRGVGGQELFVPLRDDTVSIGKSDDATLQLPGGLLVGGVHALLVPFGRGHAIEPASWWCKVVVNGRRIESRQTLQDSDVIGIGPFELTYRDVQG